MHSRPRIKVLSILVGLILTAASACASDAELDTFAPQGAIAEELHSRAVVPVFVIAGLVLIFIGIVLFWLIKKYRVNEYEDDTGWPAQTHGHTPLEWSWTAGFFFTMLVVAALMIWATPTINSTKANAADVVVDGVSILWEPTVVVIGNQWWWEFRYYFNDQVTLESLREIGDAKNLPPADIVTSGQMMIPISEEIELIITSRDVIHSFWIPALNGKRDAVPNRFSPWKIEASERGVYFGQCTEFCGLSHSRMQMQVVALSDEEFQDWINSTTQDAPKLVASDTTVFRGQEVFAGTCTSCHLVEGLNDSTYERADQASEAAPNLTHFANRSTFAGGILNTYNADGSFNRRDMERWLRTPEEVKANYTVPGEQYRGMPNLNLSEQQIDDLVEYLRILGEQPADWIIEATQVE
ncbi:MAG: cytochrome c oxidase subunit II [Acidimicrobiaceae bacterium]|nr:cytochrome c oxidase subunit II [Acidimicrobiaceae bacterium]